MERKSPFKFDLAKCPPQVVAKGGTIQEANQGTFPNLAGNGLSIYLLTLEPGAVRIPHWHPDAAELDYCLTGKARFGLSFPDAEWERFDLETGQIAIKAGASPDTILHGPGNSQPHKVAVCGSHEIDVHALKAHSAAKCNASTKPATHTWATWAACASRRATS